MGQRKRGKGEKKTPMKGEEVLSRKHDQELNHGRTLSIRGAFYAGQKVKQVGTGKGSEPPVV